MHIRFHGVTDIGRKRECNEDSFAVHETNHLVIVCDGMGGHSAGDLASRMAVETVGWAFKKMDKQSIDTICKNIEQPLPSVAKRTICAVRLANRRIYNIALRDKSISGMGSTIVVTYFVKNHIVVSHVGDSRCYRLRNNQLQQLTSDHSWVNELLIDKEITEEEAKNFKQKNVITRALGIKYAIKIDLQIGPVQANDKYLICSDGLSGVIDDETITTILVQENKPLDEIGSELIAKANAEGGPDNITVALAHIDTIDESHDKQVALSLTTPEEDEDIQNFEDKVLRDAFNQGEKSQGKKSVKSLLPVFIVCIVLFVVLWWVGGKSGLFSSLFGSKSGTRVEDKQSDYLTGGSDPDSALPNIQTEENNVKLGKLVLLSFNKDLNENGQVYVDGEFIGYLMDVSKTGGHALKPGSHRFEVSIRGNIVFKETFDMVADGVVKREITLK